MSTVLRLLYFLFSVYLSTWGGERERERDLHFHLAQVEPNFSRLVPLPKQNYCDPDFILYLLLYAKHLTISGLLYDSKTELPPLPESLDLFNEFPTVPFIDPPEISPNITPYLLPAPSIRDHFDDFNADFGSWDDNFPSYYEDLSVQTAPASTSSETFNIDYTGGNDLAVGVHANCNGDEEKTRGGRHGGRLRSTSVDFDEISRHFYMPITQAAREMKVGLTVLKKRCRELGISRWPHRKMKSLKSLIHNVQEIGRSSDHGGDIRLTREVEKLEEQKRQMEKEPEMQLTETIKKLRQACFKANYKKRRMMIANA